MLYEVKLSDYETGKLVLKTVLDTKSADACYNTCTFCDGLECIYKVMFECGNQTLAVVNVFDEKGNRLYRATYHHMPDSSKKLLHFTTLVGSYHLDWICDKTIDARSIMKCS